MGWCGAVSGDTPIAIVANAGRVTITGIMTQVKPELAEGFFHESTGWVNFIGAMAIPILFHRVLGRVLDFLMRRRLAA